MLSDTLGLLIGFLLVLLNGFFVAAEFALVKVRSTRVVEMANQGRPSARMALRCIRQLDSYLSATQLGITLSSIGLGWIGEPAMERLLHPVFEALHMPSQVQTAISFIIPFSLISMLHIVIGELVPKSWAIQKSETVVLAIAYPLHWFYSLFRWAIQMLNWMASLILRPIGIRPASEHELSHSQEEIRMILTASGESGVLKDSEVDLVKHVFEFADKTAGEIMVPRVDMVYLDAQDPLEQLLRIADSHTYTRFPLCEGDPDHVLGMVHTKDLLRLGEIGGDIRTIRRELLFVPESKSIDMLLREFQRRKLHMAVVVDQYGGTAGIVTLEDVLEQIVGDIHDEFEEPLPEVQTLPDGSFLVDGRALLSDLRADYGWALPPEESETLGGWVLDRLGEIPLPGTRLQADGFQLMVKSVVGRRVRQVLITPPTLAGENGSEAHASEQKATLPVP